MWERLRYLAQQARLKSQQQIHDNLIICQSCKLWVYNICSGVKGMLKKQCLIEKSAESVKNNEFYQAVWILIKYIFLITHVKLFQLLNNLVIWLKNWVVVLTQLTDVLPQHGEALIKYYQSYSIAKFCYEIGQYLQLLYQTDLIV